MKVAIVTNSFTYCRTELFERLAQKKGYKITIFKYASWWDKQSSEMEIKKYQFIAFKLPFVRDDVYIHFDPRVLWSIIHGDWDIIIAYGYGSLTTWLVAVVAKLRRIPFLLWSDARLEYERDRFFLIRISKSLLHLLTDHFIASGSSTLLFFKERGVSEHLISIVPYVIDNEVLSKQANVWRNKKQSIRSELHISNSSIVILCVARLIKDKGIEELILSFKDVAKGRDCSLVLVGDGPDSLKFKKMVKDMNLEHVVFVGQVPQDLVAKYYAIADIFVLPSYKDVWGIVINEAMACGLPVITTFAVGAWRDLVRHGENGFVVRAKSVEGLTNSLKILCENSLLRQKMGQRSREIIQQWDIRHAIQAIEPVLLKVRLKKCRQ